LARRGPSKLKISARVDVPTQKASPSAYQSTRITELLHLANQKQVEAFLERIMDKNAYRWASLGGEVDPAGLIGAQPDPMKALIERIVNMHDAMIEKGRVLDEEPETPRDAAVRWLGVSRDLSKEDDDTLRDLGKQTRVEIVPTSKKGYPTVRFRDAATGCVDENGQLDLKKTILSLLHRNKATKKYVAGLFGFGGSTTLWHCSYTIIVSRPRPSRDVRDIIGWTIVRRRAPQGNEKRDQFEYLARPDSETPLVKGADVPQDMFPTGTFVAHIEYDLQKVVGTSELFVTGPDMLYQRLRYLLFNPVLPLWVEAVNTDGKPFKITQARTISGNLRVLNKKWDEDKGRKLQERDQILDHGKYRNKDGLVIRYWTFNVRKDAGDDDDVQANGATKGKQANPYISRYLGTWYKSRADPIVLTINGQTHYSFPVSTFRQFGLQLLENYLLVQIDLDEMDWKARRDIFNQIASTRTDLKPELRDMLIEELGNALGKSNQSLWFIVDFLVQKILSQTIEDSRIDKYLRKIIRNYETRSIGQGPHLTGAGPIPTNDNVGSKEYRPNYIPTKFQFDEYPDPLQIAIDSKKMVRILTDAPDDMLDRDKDRGEIEIITSDNAPITVVSSKPYNGIITLSLMSTHDVTPGSTATVEARLRIRRDENPVYLETDPLNLIAVHVDEPAFQQVDPPTKLAILTQSNPIRLRRGRTTSVSLEFDGPDDFFERELGRGEMSATCTIEGVDASSGDLTPHNGRITRFVKVPESIDVGTSGSLKFQITAKGVDLVDSRECLIEEPKQRTKRYGEPSSDETTANFDARWVYENDETWNRLGFTSDHVARAESMPDGKLMIWVNRDNSRLKDFLKFRRERVNESEALLNVERYKMQMAYYSYQRIKHSLADTDSADIQKEYQRVAETTMIALLPLQQIGQF